MSYNFRLTSYLSIALFLLGGFFLSQPKTTQTTTIENKIVEVEQNSTNDSQVLGSSVQKYWWQTNFAGGINQGPYTIPYNNGGSNWSSYSSTSNLTIDDNGVKSTDGNSGVLISSIFDQGNYRSIVNAAFNDGYYNNVVSLRGANSPEGVLSATWTNSGTGSNSGVCPIPFRYLQYKLSFPIPDNSITSYVNKVTFTGQLLIITGRVTNAKTGVGINGVKVTVDGNSYITEPRPGDKQPGYYGMPIGFITDGNASLTASYPGYKTTSKNFSMTTDSNGCPKDIEGNVTIEPLANNTTTQPAPTETISPIKKTVLPTGFTQEGSSTTDLSKVEDPTKVPNLTLEIPKKNKIVFAEAVDLSSQIAADVFSKLDTYVKADKVGVVEIDSKTASFLNKKAHIVMYNLPHKNTPKILVNGKEDPKIVSNIKYSSGTLNFDVAHFTKFEAVAQTNTATTSANSNSNNNLLFGISFVGLGIIVFIGGYLIYRKKKLIKPTT